MTVTSSVGLPSLEASRMGLPNICGWEAEIEAVTQKDEPVFLPTTPWRPTELTAGFACALHMHQPTIPAGANGALISNLQYMFEHPAKGITTTPNPLPGATSGWGN